jgi:hypothetical protein
LCIKFKPVAAKIVHCRPTGSSEAEMLYGGMVVPSASAM